MQFCTNYVISHLYIAITVPLPENLIRFSYTQFLFNFFFIQKKKQLIKHTQNITTQNAKHWNVLHVFQQYTYHEYNKPASKRKTKHECFFRAQRSTIHRHYSVFWFGSLYAISTLVSRNTHNKCTENFSTAGIRPSQ